VGVRVPPFAPFISGSLDFARDFAWRLPLRSAGSRRQNAQLRICRVKPSGGESSVSHHHPRGPSTRFARSGFRLRTPARLAPRSRPKTGSTYWSAERSTSSSQPRALQHAVSSPSMTTAGTVRMPYCSALEATSGRRMSEITTWCEESTSPITS